MKTLSRRSLLRTSALAGMVALAACTVTTTNGVTTITLNVDKVKNYGQAGLNAASAVISFLSTIPAMAPYVAAIAAAKMSLSTALNAFSMGAGSTLTISYNDATWKTRVDSILTALDTVSGSIENALAGSGALLSTRVLTDSRIAQSALSTIISVFKGLLGVSWAVRPGAPAMTRDMVLVGAPVPATGMTEEQALRALGV